MPGKDYIGRIKPDDKTEAFDYDGSGNLIYFGSAEPGSAKNAAKWKISKLTYDGSNKLLDIQWADGDLEEDNVWNDRASLTYS